jgi:RNA polymerase sigma-70 factor (ECF subfamily)
LNQQPDSAARFEQMALPCLDSAYSLARHLCGNNNDAEDVVQESFLRAFKAFETFRGDNIRAWLLTIVRNTCYTWLNTNRARRGVTKSDELLNDVASDDPSTDPQTAMDRQSDRQSLHDALALLPPEHREVIVLRELEGFSYRQIAEMAHIPIGTVMSRLARARENLAQCVKAQKSADL